MEHVSFYHLDPPALAAIEEAGESEIIEEDGKGPSPDIGSDTMDVAEKETRAKLPTCILGQAASRLTLFNRDFHLGSSSIGFITG